MDLYLITLPKSSNDGRIDYEYDRRDWEKVALQKAGGFTELGARRGAWKDPDSGVVYDEEMVAYQVACDRDTMLELVDEAMRLFPDQLAFFTAKIGEAEIVSAGVRFASAAA